MTPRLLAQIVAAGRVLVGLMLFVAPTRVTRHWVGATEGERTGTKVMAMGLGARDIVVGAGALAALNAGDGDAAKPWLLGSAAADLMDLTATLRAAGDLPTGAVAGTVLVAGGAAAAGIYVLTQDV
ncbi:MAG: hypothetical protein WKF94_08305 [Solirubrobacteraceae bacterium]